MFADFLQQQKKIDTRTDREIGNDLGVSHHSISKWRQGKYTPSLRNFNNVMKYFEVDKGYAIEMWEDVLQKRRTKKKQKRKKSRNGEYYFKDTRGKHLIQNCKEEFYGLEEELIADFGKLQNVPENNRKLKKLRKLVGV